MTDETAPQEKSEEQAELAKENAQLTEGKGFMDDPRIQKYLGRATKTMLLFAVLGCALIVVAVTAISYTFNSIFDKLPH